jgi:hypothetical protein
MLTQVGPLIAPSFGHRGDPPPRNAELTVYTLGDDPAALLPALRLLGEFSARQLRQVEGSLPCTLRLPRAYYDKHETFLALARSSGARFTITTWAWLCPDEVTDERAGKQKGLHWCTATCPVAQYEEVLRS